MTQTIDIIDAHDTMNAVNYVFNREMRTVAVDTKIAVRSQILEDIVAFDRNVKQSDLKTVVSDMVKQFEGRDVGRGRW